MSWEKFDTIVDNETEFKEELKALRKYFIELEDYEQSNISIKDVERFTGMTGRVIISLFNRLTEECILKEYKTCKCEICGSELGEISYEASTSVFCDICGEDIENFKIETRYKLIDFICNENNVKIPDNLTEIKQEKKISKDEMKNLKNRMPIINYLTKKINTQPFQNIQVIVILHFLKDLLVFMECLENLGIKPFETIMFYKKYLYPHKDEVTAYLTEKGYHVYPLELKETILRNYQEKLQNTKKEVIIIEDGGYLVPLISDSPDYISIKELCIGAVEQTTKGIREDEQVDKLTFPVLSVAKCDFKNDIEPSFVADAVVKNIENLTKDTLVPLNGKNGLVIGLGSIGKEIVRILVENKKMNISVYDKDSAKVTSIKSKYACESVSHLPTGVEGKRLIIGSTGNTSIEKDAILRMSNNTILVSSSSDQHEIGLFELDALSSEKTDLFLENRKIGTKYVLRGGMSNSIFVIADGYPINFWANDSMPDQVSDTILSLILLSALKIASDKQLPNEINQDIVNELEKEKEISSLYRKINMS